jgi:hypothetical protein
MHHLQRTSFHTERALSERRQLLIGILSGLLVTSGQFFLLYLSLSGQVGASWPPQWRLVTVIALWLWLSFSVALTTASLIARRTGAREDGYTVGGATGCTAALLTTIGCGVWLVFAIVSTLPSSQSPLIGHLSNPSAEISAEMTGALILLYIILIVLNILSFAITLIAGWMGGGLGEHYADD